MRMAAQPCLEQSLRYAAIGALLAGGCAAALGASTPPARAEQEPRIANVVVFLVDTLRADHLKCYDYFRDTSPNVDAFAAEGVLFERACAHSSWTRTSVASLFTSLHPVSHGCQDEPDSMSDKLVTMAEVFKANGYATGGFSSNISISEKFNCQQGFDFFHYFEREPFFKANPGRKDPGYVPIEGMIPDTLKWIDANGDKPFFLYFHCTDPHYQYIPPDEYALWSKNNPFNSYDGEIRYMDAFFGKFIDHLRGTGKLDSTLIIFTADHGEEWGDHGGASHGYTLYNEVLHVPLIFRHPKFKPLRRPELVRQVDILPTLIELCALKPADAMIQGRSLAALLAGQPDPQPDQQFIQADLLYPAKMEGYSYECAGWKAIFTIRNKPMSQRIRPKENALEVFYTRQDAAERINIQVIDPTRGNALLGKLNSTRAAFEKQFKIEALKGQIDPETLQKLKSLGYAQ